MSNIERKSKETLSAQPVLEIPTSFMREMITEISKYPDLETGGKIYGIDYKISGTDHIIPLASFTPFDVNEITRKEKTVDIEDNSCVMYEKWAWVYWENAAGRIEDPDIRETELKLLGTWHQHPKGSAEYSKSTDLPTTDKYFEIRPNKEHLLFIILSESDPKNIKNDEQLYVDVNEGKRYDINYYYRNKIDTQIKKLNPIIGLQEFPGIPEPPWFVKNPKLYETVFGDLESSGFDVNPEIRVLDNKEVPELCLTCQSLKSYKEIFVRTSNDFDATQMVFIRNRDFNQENTSEMQIFLKDYDTSSIGELLKYYNMFNP